MRRTQAGPLAASRLSPCIMMAMPVTLIRLCMRSGQLLQAHKHGTTSIQHFAAYKVPG